MSNERRRSILTLLITNCSLLIVLLFFSHGRENYTAAGMGPAEAV